MGEIMNQIDAQMAVLSMPVQYWMNWMGLIFIASILFVWKKVAARYVLLTLPLTMAIGILVFYLSGTVHLMGIAHLLVWSPLLYYLLRFEIKREGFNFKSIYGVWLGLVIATIIISLLFDIRDVILVMMGYK